MGIRDYKGSARAAYLSGAIDGSALILPTTGLTGWPTGDNGPFFAVINRQKANEEKILCELVNGTDITVLQRGADDTAPQSHPNNSIIEHAITATDAREANTHLNDPTQHIQVGSGDRPETDLQVGQFYYDSASEILYVYGADSQWHATTAHPRLEENLDMQNTYRVVNLVDPVDAQDAATKSWVESAAQDITAGDAALARDWAIKIDGPVADGEYSSKYHATDAKADAAAAAGSASSAATSALDAAASASNAAQIWTDFEKRYLGAHDTSPSKDGQGNALVAGALYYNSVEQTMYVYDGSVWIAASSASVQSMVTYEFLATEGQTDFSGTDLNSLTLQFDGNNIQVFLNGVLMSPGDDYTTSAGTVTLLDPASVNDVLNVVAFTGFVVADHYSKAESDAKYAAKIEPDRVGQVTQSLDGSTWAAGMSFNIVPKLPAEDDPGYEIGDIVFVVEELA